MSILTLFKIVLSLPIAYGLAYPFIHSTNGAPTGGILGEISVFGPAISAVVVCVFLMLVVLYARDLVKCLRLVSPEARAASPNSVWWMLVLPYNFIEDFFIMINIAKSLQTESMSNPALAQFTSFGKVSGLAWCVCQIISLLPNEVGSLFGLIAMVFWGWHWAFIRRANRAMLESKPA